MLGAVFSELGAVFRKLKTGLFVSRDGYGVAATAIAARRDRHCQHYGRHQGAHSQPGGTF